jgi:hypothetical protein
MQLMGGLYVSGSSGVAGQVLVSDGMAVPNCQTLSSARDNNVRFGAEFAGNSTSTTTPSLTYSTAYNLNPTAVGINAGNNVVNRSGLCHIEGYFAIRGTFTSAPALYHAVITVAIAGRHYEEMPWWQPVQRDNGYVASDSSVHRFVHEVYIDAPGIITASQLVT